jgi:hypothetical protein
VNIESLQSAGTRLVGGREYSFCSRSACKPLTETRSPTHTATTTRDRITGVVVAADV